MPLLRYLRPAKKCSFADSTSECGPPPVPRVQWTHAQPPSRPGAAFLGLCHRLDRPVSGAMVFARTSKAASHVACRLASAKGCIFSRPALSPHVRTRWRTATRTHRNTNAHVPDARESPTKIPSPSPPLGQAAGCPVPQPGGDEDVPRYRRARAAQGSRRRRRRQRHAGAPCS